MMKVFYTKRYFMTFVLISDNISSVKGESITFIGHVGGDYISKQSGKHLHPNILGSKIFHPGELDLVN